MERCGRLSAASSVRHAQCPGGRAGRAEHAGLVAPGAFCHQSICRQILIPCPRGYIIRASERCIGLNQEANLLKCLQLLAPRSEEPCCCSERRRGVVAHRATGRRGRAHREIPVTLVQETFGGVSETVSRQTEHVWCSGGCHRHSERARYCIEIDHVNVIVRACARSCEE
jgi:hypothetical protein